MIQHIEPAMGDATALRTAVIERVDGELREAHPFVAALVRHGLDRIHVREFAEFLHEQSRTP